MTDLKRMNGGLKLIKHILRTAKQTNQPWTNKQQKLIQNKNTKPKH